MPAISTYEQLLFRGGPLPGEIFADQPGGNAPIPTTVRYRDSRGADETYHQELDDQGRLLRVTLGSTAGALMNREWNGDETFDDSMADGWRRRVEAGPEGELLLRGPGGTLIELWTTPADEPGDHSYQHVREVQVRHGFPETYAAEIGPDGRLIQEREWYTAGFDLDLPPIGYRQWNYTGSGRLVTVGSYHVRLDPEQPPYYNEEYRWVGDATLHIVGTYSQPGEGLVARRQTREYDSDGRVERITGSISVPTSAMNSYEMELGYN